MDPKVKRVLSALFIILSVAAVFCIAFGNPELSSAWDALGSIVDTSTLWGKSELTAITTGEIDVITG